MGIKNFTLLFFFFLVGGSLIAQPANDLCSAAQSITPDGSCVSGTTVSAADNWTGTVGCQAAAGTHPEVWYSFVSTGNSYVGTVIASGSWSGNVEFTLVTGTCAGGFTAVGDACGASPLSVNIAGLTVGATYYFTVSEKGTANVGPFSVCSSTPLATIPSNDDCSNATSLGTLPAPGTCGSGVQTGTAVVVAGTNVAATEESPYVSLTGCGMASPANSVWYSFVQPVRGYGLTINVSGGTLANPNIALWSGTTCTSLSGVNCIVGSSNTATLTVSNGMIPGQTYYIQLSGNTGESGTYNLSVNAFQDCSDCLNASSLTVSPLPVNGMYDPGQTVSFCFHIDRWTQTVNNWLHGVQMAFGSGWDLPTLTTTPPAAYVSTSTFWGAVSPSSCGNWAYYPGGTTSSASGVTWPAGFYFDGVYTTNIFGTVTGCGSLTGNPGNNFGDGVPNSGLIITPPANQWNFCWTIKVKTGCNPGMSLSVAVNTSGDGESGSWTSIGCTNDPAVNFTAQISCCPPTMSSTGTCTGLSNGTATATPDGAAAPYTYSWSAGGQNTQTITGLAAGTYTVTVVDVNLCTATASVTVATNANPTVAPTATPATICNGASTTLAANATAGSGSISTYAWSIGLAGSVSGGSVSPTSNTTYTITVTNSNTCTATGTVTVTVNAKPTVAPTAAPSTICNGTSTTLAANAVAGSGSISTYAWSSGLAGNVAGGTVSPTTNTTYTVTVTNSNSCTVTGTVTVAVNAKPTIAPTATPTAICNGGSTTLAANATAGSGSISTYAWSSGLAGSISGGSVSPTTNTTYTVTVTNSNTCTATGTVSVTVNALPTVAPTAGPAIICVGQSTTLAANATAGSGSISTYAWSSGLGNVASGSVSPLTNTTYTITVTNSNGCTATASVSVTVNAKPTVAPTVAPSTICNGQSTTLAANATAGSGSISTYAWSTGLAGNVSGGNVSPTTNTTYTVTVTNSNSCTATGTVSVSVNANPTVSPSATGNICAGASATLAANATAGSGSISTYAWSSGLAGNVAGGTVSPASTTTYTVTVTNSNSCTVTGSVSVNVNATPTVALTATPAIICNGGTTTLAANATAGSGSITVYTWNGGVLGNVSGGSVSPTINTTYTVTVTNSNSCTATGIVSVTVNANPTVTPTVTPPAICNGQSTTLAANATAGSGSISTYAWSSGLAGNVSGGSVSPTTNTTYTVTVTNSNTCTVIGTVSVTVNTLPTVAPTATPATICNGQSTALVANATAGSGSISTYAWSSGLGNVASGSVSPTTNTTYTVTVTNSNSCTVTGTVSVTVNANPTVAPTATLATICNGQSTALAANATAGSGVISTYVWSSGLAGNVSAGSVSPITNTTYTVTVTNSNSCTVTGTVSVTVNANPTVAPTVAPSAICNGQSTTLAANATAGSGSISTYAWSSGLGNVASGSVSPTTNTTYTVTVTNSNTCTATASITVTINPLPSPTATNTGPYCATSTIQFNAGGGTSYSWSGPAAFANGTQNPTRANATLAMAGTYTVTVTDANGCSATATTTVVVNSSLTPVASNTGSYCVGGTVQLNIVGGNTYSWSGPNSFSDVNQNPSISNATTLMSGTYNVTATDLNGCSGTTSTNVVVNPLPSPSASNTGPYCAGVSIQLNSSGGNSYSWSGPNAYSNSTQNSTIANSTVTMSGIYSVTVTDVNGCTATVSTNVIVNANPTVAPSAAPVTICNGGSTTLSANATAGSGAISTYAWSSGLGNVAGGSVSPTTNTTYTITVTDVNACSVTGSVSVTVNANPTVTPTTTPSTICNGQSTTLSANGVAGSGTISAYTWSSGLVGNISGGSVSPTTNTTYTITVTNSNACTATGTVSVTVNQLPIPAASNNGPLCVGTTLQLNSSGGNSYSWSGPNAYTDGTQNPTVTNSTIALTGTYQVTVADLNGCSATASTNVVINNALVPVASNTGPYCPGTIVQLNITGGNSYSWSGPLGFTDASQNPTLANATTTMSGTYTVTATDLNGCSGTASTSVIVNAPPVPSASNAGLYCQGGSIQLNSGGGVSYIWSGPNAYSNTTQNPSLTNATVAMSGTYTVTATSAANCTDTASTFVTVIPAMILSTTTGNVSCNGGANGTINLTVTNGQSPYTFTWSNAATSQNISGIPVGSYTVTVTDNAACTATTSAVISQPTALNISETHLNVLCNGVGTGSITLTVAGGTPGYNYNWNDAITTQNRINLIAGNYSVTVTDANSCTAATSIIITQPQGMNLTTSFVNPTCETNNADGSIALNVTGGSLPYAYNWSNGFTSTNLINIGPGNYVVTISDANTCSVSAAFMLVYQYDFSVSATPSVTIYIGENTTLGYTLNGITGNYVSVWSPSTTLSCIDCVSPVASPVITTLYQIQVTNDAGCLANDNVTVYVVPDYSVFVPNVFSPNSDGNNDVFEIYGNLKGLAFLEIQIFNRWGEKVFESNDHHFKWDGTFKGAVQNPAVFVWQLKLSFLDGHKEELRKGSVTLLR